MGKIPDELRRIIAVNIRAARIKKFPGHGGGKRCVEAFSDFIGKNISHQQWSPWEHGIRTPEETRLRQMADFFETTVEELRRDQTESALSEPQPVERPPSFPHLACIETDIIWQLHKIYSGVADDGRRLHISLNLVLSEEKLV